MEGLHPSMGWKYHYETGLHGMSQNEVTFCRFPFKRILNRPFEGFEGFEGVMKILETTPYDPNHPSLFAQKILRFPARKNCELSGAERYAWRVVFLS